jgi:hypothetical protein
MNAQRDFLGVSEDRPRTGQLPICRHFVHADCFRVADYSTGAVRSPFLDLDCWMEGAALAKRVSGSVA